MVKLMRSGRADPEAAAIRDKFPVKSEIEDSLEEEHGPLNKRSKSSSPFDELALQWSNLVSRQRKMAGLLMKWRRMFSSGENEFPIPPSQYNPLDEPSPLGLRLRKSPSLLDLIQMRLTQGNVSSVTSAPSGNLSLRDKKDVKGTATSATTDKLKASNFPAVLLRIGQWEYASRFEGDLVAKCYFAKHKLVWEILESGLKSKIEIQWSDIIALKANLPDDGPGSLTVTLARPPHFFKETNPQPRKHTLWQATADFTDGQAIMHRHQWAQLFHGVVSFGVQIQIHETNPTLLDNCSPTGKVSRHHSKGLIRNKRVHEIMVQHFLQCTQGLLNKHYEKLIQCDMHLNLVSRQPEMVLDSPYFDARGSVLKDPNESEVQEVDQLETAKRSPSSGFQVVASPSTAQSCSLKIEEQNSVGIASEHSSPESPSPSSVMDLRANGSHGGDGLQAQRDWEQIKVPGLRQSMSMSDLVNHIGHCISERMASGNSPCRKEALECQDMLENIAQALLSDTQFTTASDEKTLMSRVNSLCCLLQDPATAPNMQVDCESQLQGLDDRKHIQASESMHENAAGSMSRKDSFGDLLLSLPRITSLPKFLFDISEDDENQDRSCGWLFGLLGSSRVRKICFDEES
ncbi:hypothetical protein TEA_027831 [Camellia sinensis var. sinensis]|uniref:TRF2/HOY1 PH-like domain-containing protein n=1 Tax=Camellia sinensis var. sinensis TaxID=542762 RepID=A0A4S4DLB0_CAMSN|nr:hypothetical protein TEA_027831 [Camellia sinensis var. sinensis]